MVIFAVLMALITVSNSYASTTYTYVGPTYTDYWGTYFPGHVSISVVVPTGVSLSPDSPTNVSKGVTFTISDGYTTLSSTGCDPSLTHLQINSLGSTGLPTSWDVAAGNNGSARLTSWYVNSSSFQDQTISYYPSTSQVCSANPYRTGPGYWSIGTPSISGTPTTTATVGGVYQFTPSASNATGFSITNKPAWAIFDASTGVLSGTPTNANVGTYSNIVITASNGSTTVSLPAFAITVNLPAPTIAGTPATTATAGFWYSFVPTATNATSFSIANKPSWAGFDSTTGALSGTLTAASLGSFQNIVITATNSAGSVSLPAFSVTVANPIAGSSSWQQTNGPLGGDVAALAIDRSNSQNIYAVTGGGVFKTINGGNSWSAVNTGMTGRWLSSVVIDPNNSSTIYAGSDIDGVFKSSDGGSTWKAVNNGLSGTEVQTLAVDPANGLTIYAGTANGGIAKSTDGGSSWSAANTGFTGVPYVWSLAVDPSNSQTVYAGIYDGGVFKSTNGGASWTAMNTGLSSTFSDWSLAIDPTNSQVIYAGNGGGSGVFKSTNGGASWSSINSGLTSTNIISVSVVPTNSQTIFAVTADGVFRSTNGGTSWSAANSGLPANVRRLAVDQTNDQTVYAATAGGGVYRSTNGGGLWTMAGNSLAATEVYSVAMDPSNSQTLYAAVYRTGVFKSVNGGANWSGINTGISNSAVWAVAVDPATPQNIYVSTWGGGVFKSANGGSSWSASNNGLASGYVAALAIDPTQSQTLYAGTNGGLYKSTNGGATWSAAGLLNTGDIMSIAIDPGNHQTIYAGVDSGGVGVFKSTDGGASWSGINNGLAWNQVASLAIDPASSQTIYAGLMSGGICKSTDGGSSWSAVNSGLATNLEVSAIAIDPANPKNVYAGTWGSRNNGVNGGGMYKSTDGGNSWTTIGSGLSTWFGISSLVIDPANSQSIYAGTDGNGVFHGLSIANLPTIGGTAPSTVTVGSAFSFRPTATDATSFSYTGTLPPGLSFNTTFGSINGTPTTIGTYGNIVITATNAAGSVSMPAITITIVPTTPTISGTPATSATSGLFYSFTPTATNATSFSISNLPSWASFNAATGALTGSPMVGGTYGNIVITANNAAGSASLPPFAITVTPIAISNPITFKFTGTVSSIDSQLSGAAQVGDSITGSYTFDPATPDLAPSDPTFGNYVNSTANYWVKAGSFLSTGTGVNFNIFHNLVLQTYLRDQYRAALGGSGPSVNGYAYNGFTLDLLTQAAAPPNVITSDALPTTPPSISAFAMNQLRFYFVDQSNGVYYIIGNLTSLTMNPATISGTPAATDTAGAFYSFTPAATNATSFAIGNKPSWASFDTTTGALTGTPTGADVAAYNGIVITASNGTGSVSLPAFSITVLPAPVNGSCGTSKGGTFAMAPTSGLCATGTASTVTGTGPWNWSCTGLYGGSSASCSAALQVVNMTAPGAPALTMVTTGLGSATVTFAAPANDGGSPITGYTVASSPAGGVDQNAGSTLLTHRVTGLVNGTAYTFTVTATNGAGTGPTSAASDPAVPGNFPRIQLSQTGQTSCWDAHGNLLPSCAGSGQDGDKQAGVVWPDTRFISADGSSPVTSPIVVDTLTGLQWVRDAAAPSYGQCDGGALSWADALTYVACLNFNNYLGHSDWRLPNVNELATLPNRQQTDNSAWLNLQGFTNVGPTYYWTSTTKANNSATSQYAWYVNMYDRSVDNSPKSNQYLVLPVRSGLYENVPRTGQTGCWDANGNPLSSCAGSGQDGDKQAGVSWPNPRLTNLDLSVPVTGGTLFDRLTGLQWVTDGSTLSFANCGGGQLNWQGSLNYVACLNANNYLGYSDWRLPNQKELLSLINWQQNAADWLNSSGFSNISSTAVYWSSDTDALATGEAWPVRLSIGYSPANSKTSTQALTLPVRGGAVVPAAPAITAIATSSGQATLSFTPPPANGSAPLSGYTVTAKPGNIPATGSGSPITVSGLTNGVLYTFYLAAVNSSGTGKSAKASAQVTAQVSVNGHCGSANGGTFSSAPSVNLCSAGTPTAVSGTGPLSWSCAGSGGGASANCLSYLTANVAAPITTIAPAGGSYTSGSVLATLTCTNTSATIYYTTDGSTPTTASQVYATPITVTGNKTVRYFAVDPAGNIEPVRTATYAVTSSGPPAASFTTFKSGTAFTVLRSEGGAPATPVATDPTSTTFTDTSAVKPNTVYTYQVASDTDPNAVVFMTIRTPMYNGWNIIGVPYDTTGVNPASFFGSSVSSIYQWIPTGATPESSSSVLGLYNTVNGLLPGNGYFVRANNGNTMLVYAGTTGPSSATVTLKPGWTMIANPQTTNKTNLGSTWLIDGASLADAITANKIGGSVYWWNGTTYDSWTILGNNPQIEPWKGYWIVNIDSVPHTLTIQ